MRNTLNTVADAAPEPPTLQPQRVRGGSNAAGMGICWRKLGLDGTNANQLTRQHRTDLNRGPVFYDCPIQVQAD